MPDAQVIFRDAGDYNMTESGHVWFVTEQALSANNTPDGVLGLQLEHAISDNRHIRVRLISFTVKVTSAL
ncbi:glutamate [NMDA] receptor subunit 1-like isoform 2-T2 [Glossina fuscipes fuscipes]